MSGRGALNASRLRPGTKWSLQCVTLASKACDRGPRKWATSLVTRDFGTGTRGFADVDDLGSAVCLMPGTELAFAGEVARLPS